MQHIAITGMYRSGTTLLHHLLDGHPILKVFPVENCVLRDSMFADLLPNSKQRSLKKFFNQIKKRGLESEAVEFIMTHEKLGLPLTKEILLSGSMGDQKVAQNFDEKVFKDKLTSYFNEIYNKEKPNTEIALYKAYQLAYFSAIGDIAVKDDAILVNKCPEGGVMVDFLLRQTPSTKVIHIIRDPRGVVASHKAAFGKNMYQPSAKFFRQLNLIANSLRVAEKFKGNANFLCVRYEDLVERPKETMSQIAEFIDIPMSQELLQPTICGVSWKANSSNLDQNQPNYTIGADLQKFYKKLNQCELDVIEEYLNLDMFKAGYSDLKKVSFFRRNFLQLKYLIRAQLSLATWIFRIKRKLLISSS